jgi:hypothetical protein
MPMEYGGGHPAGATHRGSARQSSTRTVLGGLKKQIEVKCRYFHLKNVDQTSRFCKFKKAYRDLVWVHSFLTTAADCDTRDTTVSRC